MVIEISKDGKSDALILKAVAKAQLSELQLEVLTEIGCRLRASSSVKFDEGIGGRYEQWIATLSASTTEFRHTEIVSIIREHGMDVAIK